MKPSKKLDQLSTSIFSQLLVKKNQKLQLGQNIIDLSIGSPDLPPPDIVKKSLSEHVLEDGAYAYPLTGTEEFKQAVTYFYSQRYHVDLQTSNVLQIIGSQEGLSHLALAYLDQEDVVIVPDPGYPIYEASVQIAGAQIYPVPLIEDNDFLPDLSSIPEDVAMKAKMMILNFPGNPIPTLATREFFEQVIEFGLKYKILIVHDFAYSELIFDQQKPLSILSIPKARETAIEFNSLSKSFNMAGCRIAYVVGDEKLIEPLAILKSHMDYGVFLPIQKAAALVLKSDFHFLDEHKRIYQQRRDTFIHILHDKGWNVRKPEGGMFVWAKLREDVRSMDFAFKAIDYGVLVTPGVSFGAYGEGYIRLALVHPEDVLEQAAERLVQCVGFFSRDSSSHVMNVVE
ncbi:LL-diaminopimelate aminotransferase [Bacillus horti]|uniref:Aminotransferase n=1 Tax=Caldalkalibacillus horti TaxID=77523 RepID=A0ABT9W291_9BACI|nr:LL-diaminopimelate aminotransferase [Bacillus horti]MDQ0167363.1 aspartate/methionine/tyrosine aminotransferase [Bacillus horti]